MNCSIKRQVIDSFRAGAKVEDLSKVFGFSIASINNVIHPNPSGIVTTEIKRIIMPTKYRKDDKRTKKQIQRDAGYLAAQTKRRNIENRNKQPIVATIHNELFIHPLPEKKQLPTPLSNVLDKITHIKTLILSLEVEVKQLLEENNK